MMFFFFFSGISFLYYFSRRKGIRYVGSYNGMMKIEDLGGLQNHVYWLAPAKVSELTLHLGL